MPDAVHLPTNGRPTVDAILSPVLLYVLLAVGAVGVVLALPRRGVSPQLLGALIAAIGIGGIVAMLGARANGAAAVFGEGAGEGNQLPNLYFYVFAGIAFLAGLRVITHRQPVYAALYFILVILSSSALYLLMGAEFMAFALVIIYAGAILITYLFVIMLATQAPTEEQAEALSAYDAYSRDPVVSVVLGFVLLAALSGVFAKGVTEIRPLETDPTKSVYLGELPRKVVRSLDRVGAFEGLERPELSEVSAQRDLIAERRLELVIADEGALRRSLQNERFAALLSEEELRRINTTVGGLSGVVMIELPDDLRFENIDGVGYTLIAGHPMALELAGIILLMAMLGAVVLARKQIEIGEDEKSAQERRLAGGGGGGASNGGRIGPLAGEGR
ncbi:MAG: NADH-quinone oxidoreductase subunit J [Phycisphaerales bacterium]